MSQLFAGAKPVKVADECPHRDRRDDADAGLTQKVFDDRIIRRGVLHFFGDNADFCIKIINGVVMVLQQKKEVSGRDVVRIE